MSKNKRSFKKGKEDITAQRQNDTIATLAKPLPDFCDATLRFSEFQDKLKNSSRIDDDEYHAVCKNTVQMTKNMVFRGKLVCSALTVTNIFHVSFTYVNKMDHL